MAFRTGQVLLVEADAGFVALATAAARTAYCHLTSVASVAQATRQVAKRQFDLILIDTATIDADSLNRFLSLDLTYQGRVVLVGDPAVARNARARDVEYVSGAMSFEALTGLMDQALRRTPSKEIPGADAFGGMIGRTPRMQMLLGTIRRIAPLDVGVLVQGESGTGKELVARALHALSGRSGKFIAVNCGAVATELLGSQMFGHERGSFTGATQSHAGYFEQAEGGTLFLDEITEMPHALQVYLLRVIETHSLTRVGGSREISVDVRVIAASNRDLQHAVAEGDLRSDLYFRLLEFPLTIPPLRERREDVPLLAQHFLDQLNARYGTKKWLDARAKCALIKRPWPGNVRELLHTVRRQYILAGDAGTLDIPVESDGALYRRASDKQAGRGTTPGTPTGMRADGDDIRFSIGTTFEEIEREALLKTLAHFHNNKRDTARVLGVSLKTIYNKLLRYRSQGLIGQDVLNGLPEDNGRAA